MLSGPQGGFHAGALMDIEDVRTFLVLLELSSFKGTGERLGRTQAAISLRLKKLEEELGCRLVERNGRFLRATPEGELLKEEAVHLVSLHDAITSRFRQKISRKIKLGVTEDIAKGRLPSILACFAEKHPSVDIELVVDITKRIVERLHKSMIDLAIGRVDGAREPLQILETAEVKWCASHRLGERVPDPLPLVIISESYPSAVMIKALDEHERSWHIAADCTTVSGVRAAVEAGLGITVLLADMVQGDMCDVQSSWDLPQLPAAQTAIYSGKQDLSQIERAFVAFVTSEYRQQTRGG